MVINKVLSLGMFKPLSAAADVRAALCANFRRFFQLKHQTRYFSNLHLARCHLITLRRSKNTTADFTITLFLFMLAVFSKLHQFWAFLLKLCLLFVGKNLTSQI